MLRRAVLAAGLFATGITALAQAQIFGPAAYVAAPAAGGDGWTLVQSAKGCALGQNDISLGNTTSATAIMVGYNCGSASCWAGSSVDDNKGNGTYTFIGSGADSSNTGTLMWYKANPVVGSGHVVSIHSATASGGVAEAWAGAATVSPLRTSNQANTSQTAGSITPTAGDLVLAFHGPSDANNVSSQPAGYTLDQNQAYSFGNCEAGAMASKHPSDGSAINPAWVDSAGTGSSYIAAFKQ